jgi:hypothetical protein
MKVTFVTWGSEFESALTRDVCMLFKITCIQFSHRHFSDPHSGGPVTCLGRRKVYTEHKTCAPFSSTNFAQTGFRSDKYLTSRARDARRKHICLQAKRPLLLSNYNQTWNLSTSCSKIPQYKISWNSFNGSRVVTCDGTDRHRNTHTHTEVHVCNILAVNMPKNGTHTLNRTPRCR